MRIALVTDGIWPYVLGGMQKHSYYLCKYLAKNKIDVHLFHFNQSQLDISTLSFFTDAEKQYITSVVVDFPKKRHYPGHYLHESYLHSKLIFEAMAPHLSTYDFIYTKGFTGWYLMNQKHRGRIACAAIGVKFHGYEMFQKPPSFLAALKNVFLLRYPVKLISLKADVVFSYGAKITELIRSLGVTPEKIMELPSGVESSFVQDQVKPSGEKLVMLYVGRYERRKGIEELNEAIRLYSAKKKHNKLEFHFVGPIPEDKRLSDAAVIYHGEVRDKDLLQSILKNADVLMCPSWSEGMPNVILEGMASGLAVMCTNVGANAILTDQSNGWILPKPNVHAIEQVFMELNAMEASRLDKLKQGSLEKIKIGFTWEILSSQLIKALGKYK